MNYLFRFQSFSVALLAFCTVSIATGSAFAGEAGFGTPCTTTYYLPDEPSWIFRRSTFTNDPETGARVAQYMRKPPVEPLDDPRAVTSRYTRRRTNLRGIDGSFDTYYEVQSWGNGRGGLDAEWERFHDAWLDSSLQGGYYNQGSWGWGGNPGWGWGGHPGGWGWGGWNQPGFTSPGGFPGGGFPGAAGPGFPHAVGPGMQPWGGANGHHPGGGFPAHPNQGHPGAHGSPGSRGAHGPGGHSGPRGE